MKRRNLLIAKRLKLRRESGNILVLSIAIIAGIILLLAFFSLQYARMLGGHNEQQTAAEVASLAAAKALSRVLVEDEYFGFIALTDQPPTGTATAAQDGYNLPVKSINNLLATIRLDMIVADKLNDQTMKSLSQKDYKQAMLAKDKLVDKLKEAIKPNAKCQDSEGKSFSVYDDGLKAYRESVIRIAGTNKLIADSFKISLGCADDAHTTVHIPRPSAYAEIKAEQQEDDYYKAFQNISYNNYDFVFAAEASQPSLFDVKKFRTTNQALPYFIPSLVMVEADQEYAQDGGLKQGAPHQIHCRACAQPGAVNSNKPASGILSFSFPEGLLSAVESPGSLFSDTTVQSAPTDLVESPDEDDFPEAPLKTTTIAALEDEHPRFGKVIDLAFYDWIRRCGPNLNVESLIKMLNSKFSGAVPSADPQVHLYQVSSTGSIDYAVYPLEGQPTRRVSQKQYRAVAGLPLRGPNNTFYDVIIRDFVYQPGRVAGGKHAGEPLENQLPDSKRAELNEIACQINNCLTPQAFAATTDKDLKKLQDDPNKTSDGVLTSGNGIRPSYLKASMAVDIKFRGRKN
jgi:hypothetical protein